MSRSLLFVYPANKTDPAEPFFSNMVIPILTAKGVQASLWRRLLSRVRPVSPITVNAPKHHSFTHWKRRGNDASEPMIIIEGWTGQNIILVRLTFYVSIFPNLQVLEDGGKPDRSLQNTHGYKQRSNADLTTSWRATGTSRCYTTHLTSKDNHQRLLVENWGFVCQNRFQPIIYFHKLSH